MRTEWIINQQRINDYQFTILEENSQVIYISVLDDFESELKTWISKHFKILPGEITFKQEVTPANQQALDQLTEYFSGQRKTMDFPIKMYGSAKEIKVWEMLNTLQYNEIISYSELAKRVGMPTAIRYVATAVGKNPLLGIIPCHRINGKNGTLNGYRGGLDLKKKMQVLEQTYC